MYNNTNNSHNRQGSFNGMKPDFNRFAAFGIQADKPEVTIIKKKKSPVSFERRFLSLCGHGDDCVLEVAMIWRDNVMSIHEYPAKAGFTIKAGEPADCQYHVNLSGSQKSFTLAECNQQGKWKLNHQGMNGFILHGEEKTSFSDTVPETFVSGEVRAKYIFNEVTILVHYVDRKVYAASPGNLLKMSRYGALAASMILHFALFSIILFATDRVDALMIDRIMTTARFAVLVEPEVVTPDDDPVIDEVPIEEPDDVAQTDAIDRDAPSAIAPTESLSNGTHLSKSEAAAAAASAGLLSQANAMNSLLASAQNIQNLDNVEWDAFDSSVMGANPGYLLAATGTSGGASALGAIGTGGFGPQGNAQYRAIQTAATNQNVDLGKKKEVDVHVDLKKPEITGSLDRMQILRVVKNHTNELRNCYEKELVKVKGLNGRVVLTWLISPQGNVVKVIMNANESTIKNANVENCVKNSVQYWRFPAPKGGGSVMVEYPFVFSVGGK